MSCGQLPWQPGHLHTPLQVQERGAHARLTLYRMKLLNPDPIITDIHNHKLRPTTLKLI